MDYENNIKMDRQNRAKQFMPFAALKGYDEALRENEICDESGSYSRPDNYMDNPLLVPVPVIASYSRNGDVIPLYFSIEGLRVKISKVKWKDTGKEWGYHFRCEIIMDDMSEDVDLYFYKNKNVWTLRRK